MLIITAPGQGAQTPGFLAPWLELPGVTERLGAASELAGCDLIRYGTTASADEIRDTAVAQPLLVAAALVVAGAIAGGEASDLPADATAGHSVGELAAGVIAGVIGADDAMRLVRVRAAAMAAASAVEPTGMTAVLGGDQGDVLAAIARHGLTPANVNTAGQIVAAGRITDLEAFAVAPPAGARLRPLQVAGAFHTRYMAPAVAAMRHAAIGVTVTDPAVTLLSDADGAAVTTGKEWLERLIAQVAAPVRWDMCMQTMADLGVTAIIELPPAGTLTGLARRALPRVAQLAIKTPDQLDAAHELIEEHLSNPASGHGHTPEWRLIVSPTSGRFRSALENGGATLAGATLAGPPLAGAVVGHTADLGTVVARGGERAVTAPWPAEIIEWLVEDGDPVSEGQPLVRVQPQGGPGGWFPPEGREGA
jgi:[acyl-carrier-protein] S-malonyltransferase